MVQHQSLSLHDAVDLALRHASRLGVSGVEVYGIRYKRLTVNAAKGEISSVLFNDEGGIALRLDVEGRVVFSYVNSLNLASIRKLVDGAYRQAVSSPVDPYFKGFYEPSREYVFPDRIYSPVISKRLTDPRDVIDSVISAIQEYESDKFKVTWLYMGLGEARQVIANSEGVYEEFSSTFARSMVDTIGVDGVNRSPSIYEADGWRDRIPDPRMLLEKAREKAFRSLRREKIELPREYRIILTPEAFTELFNYTFGEALLGISYVNRSSPFTDKVGESIAPECLTVIDNPHEPGKLGSTPFDGEGAPTYPKKVIDKGVLKTFLFDNYYAKIAGFESTGNASRSSYTSPPGIAWSNLVIEPGDVKLDEILEDGNVIYVERIQGVFNAKFQTGDYGGAGTPAWLYLRGGEVKPLGSISVSGNIYRDIETCMLTREVEDKGSFRAPYALITAKVHTI
ncbi:MAG: TldD/PmbA family protein [Desulfurococcales archaeon]|nr:TldD/PmbA family protein [Desulfurococcales archaeon]